MSIPSTGIFQLDVTGTLQDIVDNLKSLVNDLQAQGINPTPLKNANVQITLVLSSISQSQFASIDVAITTFRQQVQGTSIKIGAQLSLQV